jgi:hypothetical protein
VSAGDWLVGVEALNQDVGWRTAGAAFGGEELNDYGRVGVRRLRWLRFVLLAGCGHC